MSLVNEGRDLLLAEGLAVGSSNLTFKRVFDRLEARTGVRLTNASVIGRVWANQVDFQADVLVTVARDEARRAEGMEQRSVGLLGTHDMTTPESRSRALREVLRVEGNASSAAIDRSANWSLWINVVSMSTSTVDPGAQARIKEALEKGYQAVTRFWSENFSALAALLGLRLRPHWSIEQFAMAAIAFAEGCAIRELAGDHIAMMVRPTGPDGADQEWSLYAIGMEALVHQFFEADPEFTPAAGSAAASDGGRQVDT